MTNTLMTLDTALQDLITGAVAAAETAGGFVAEEAPIVVEQVLAWNFTASLIMFIAGIVLIIVAIIATPKAIRACNSGGWAYAEAAEPLVVIPMISLYAISVILLFEHTWLKIAIAPKLYLLEYAADLIK